MLLQKKKQINVIIAMYIYIYIIGGVDRKVGLCKGLWKPFVSFVCLFLYVSEWESA